MDVDIRKYIINNFKDGDVFTIEQSIKESIQKGDDVTLPGLGVFFEILWNNSDDTSRTNILNTLRNNMR